MKIAIVLMMLLACVSCANLPLGPAQLRAPEGPTFSWQVPTTRTNGQPLEFSDIVRYELRITDANSSGVKQRAICQAGETSLRIEKLPPGDYSATLQVWDRYGLASALAPVQFTIAADAIP